MALEFSGRLPEGLRSAAVATAVSAPVKPTAVAEATSIMATEPTVAAAGVMVTRAAVMTSGLMRASMTAAVRIAVGIEVKRCAAIRATAAASVSNPGGDQQGRQHDHQSENHRLRHE
jgi:hypothetical protein